MTVRQVKQKAQKKGWYQYLLIGIGILLTVLLTVAIVFSWEELQDVESLVYGYGYAGGFMVSILGGITIIPIPSLLVIFALGGVLNPLYIGLISGLGEALGGITVYLTGAGGGAIWSGFQSRRHAFYDQPRPGYDIVTPAQPKLRSRWQTFYDRLAHSAGRWGVSWSIFVVSAFAWGLYYPAGLAAGTLHIGLKRFFLISWVGKTVRGLIVAYAGYWGFYFLLQWIGV